MQRLSTITSALLLCAVACAAPSSTPSGREDPLARSSCDSPAVCLRRGLALSGPDRSAGERRLGREMLERACGGGRGRACYELGVRALRAEDGDPTSALAYLDEACALEHPQGCLLAGELYRERDALRDIEVALERYRSGCVAGEALACRQAGLVELRRGSGEEAAALLDRGCLRGDRISCTKLAAVWRQGRAGHERSPHMAYSLYRRACRSGGAAGCLEVAKMYRHGAPPVLRSRERAVTFAKRACRAGSREGCALVEEASSREAVAIFEASEGAVRRALGVVSTSMQLVGIGRGIDVRDRAAIGAIVEMHGSHLEHCFESHLREDASSDVEAIEIAVGVELAGGGYGEVIDAKVLESSIGDAHLERCITSEFELMHFPLPRGVRRDRVRRFVYPLSHVRGE